MYRPGTIVSKLVELVAWQALISFISISEGHAQQQPASPAPSAANPASGANILNFFSARTPYEFWLTCLIGFIGLCIIGLLIFSLRHTRNARAEDITRPVIIVTIIFGTLILITAGYSNQQVAPAFGLFGTIVGYLLGRLGQATTPPPTQDETTDVTMLRAATNQEQNNPDTGGDR